MENLDAQLIDRGYLENKEQEKRASNALKLGKKRKTEKKGEIENNRGPKSEMSNSQARKISNTQIQSLIKKRLLRGEELKKEEEKEEISAVSFFGALIVALSKDGVDVISLGTLGWALANTAFWSFMGLNSSYRKILIRRILKRKGLVYFIAVLVESLPFVNFFPFYTIMILMIRHKQNKKVDKLRDSQRKNNREISRLRRQASQA